MRAEAPEVSGSFSSETTCVTSAAFAQPEQVTGQPGLREGRQTVQPHGEGVGTTWRGQPHMDAEETSQVTVRHPTATLLETLRIKALGRGRGRGSARQRMAVTV